VQKGFSLIELLLLTVIVGISLSVVTANLGSDNRDVLNDEALRLVSLLNYASDTSISTGRPLVWEQTPSGYRFLQRDENLDIWKPSLDPHVLKDRQLPEKIHIDSAHNQYGNIRAIFFASSGVNQPFTIIMSNGEERKMISGNLLGQAHMQTMADGN